MMRRAAMPVLSGATSSQGTETSSGPRTSHAIVVERTFSDMRATIEKLSATVDDVEARLIGADPDLSVITPRNAIIRQREYSWFPV